ncbi:MAG: hypothetical protein WC461_00165 [Candidatus Paceibacterota bacterium]
MKASLFCAKPVTTIPPSSAAEVLIPLNEILGFGKSSFDIQLISVVATVTLAIES